ncbi:hypothetical protein Tco_0772739 [Tanacetum coccineum]|uniref:Uncharacterized protein n=1 Tax=Tanacetum coccineum TaxID=301880 RepID=A0ABQ4ZIR4_9ASTR
MQFLKPNQSIISFPSRLIDDSYDEKMVLVKLMDRKESATNLKRKNTLRVGDVKIVFKSDYPTSNIIIRVYALGPRERMEFDLEATLIGEALVLNRSLDPVCIDYIELNDLNEPVELKRNQVEDLGPMIEEGEVIYEPMEDIVKTRNDDEIDEYPILENMDAYRDEGMGDVIVGKPFCREICVKVSARDKLNGISHPYQKLKSFYKGVLNLGTENIRDAKIEELLKRVHVSIHEME